MAGSKVTRQRVQLTSTVKCALCNEPLFAGVTAWYLPESGKHIHYGKCAGVQRKEDIQKALKRIGLDEDTVASMNSLVNYLYRDELKDFESREEGEPREGHIFLDIERVKKFLDGLP